MDGLEVVHLVVMPHPLFDLIAIRGADETVFEGIVRLPLEATDYDGGLVMRKPAIHE